jgi:hypothetical protein
MNASQCHVTRILPVLCVINLKPFILSDIKSQSHSLNCAHICNVTVFVMLRGECRLSWLLGGCGAEEDVWA